MIETKTSYSTVFFTRAISNTAYYKILELADKIHIILTSVLFSYVVKYQALLEY